MLTNSRDIIRRLERESWRLTRVRGSHHMFRMDGAAELLVVPHPKKDLPPGTVRAIYRAAGWTMD